MKAFFRKIALWGGVLAVLAAVVGAGWLWWSLDLRWRPKTIDKHQAEIARILESAGWVSPGLSGPKLYMVSFRTCPDCLRFSMEQFPDLHAAGVDTRVIKVARRDADGVPRSTPLERTTVAELWSNKSWALHEAWMAVPPDAWKAEGLTPADGDTARTAVVEASRRMVDDLRPLLRDNGINFAYPTLIWWTKDGRMRGCACERREAQVHVRKELGVS